MSWQYDEFKQIGTDYESREAIEAYDRQMQSLRDVAGESEHILDILGITPESTILEIGTGTGEFAVRAAARCARVYAADVSEPMLEYARKKAESRDVGNIEFMRAGFLTFTLDEPVDAIVSQLALHHLPDHWKAIALTRVYDALKDGGRFYLRDMVFPGDVRTHQALFDTWVEACEKTISSKMAREVEEHIREEHSTLDWIMEGLLTSTGFSVISRESPDQLFTGYVCLRGETPCVS